MNDKKEIVVSIKCLVYNHGPYLRQCLDGFVMQKTNFKFEAIVHDDASTDNSAEIIREYAEKYPDIIKPIYEAENQYSKHDGSISRIMAPYLIGKYVAMCEGDDYWTDPYKLQKQVDYLEAHPECGMVYTDCKFYNEKSHKVRNKKSYQVNKETLFFRNCIPTLTACYRRCLYDSYLKDVYPHLPKIVMGDLPMWLYIAHVSEVKHLPVFTGCYRELSDSASHSNNIERQIAFFEDSRKCKDFFYSYFKYNNINLKKKYSAHIDAVIIWQTVLLNSKDGFMANKYRIKSIKNCSNLLYYAFSLLNISFDFFGKCYRIINRFRYI